MIVTISVQKKYSYISPALAELLGEVSTFRLTVDGVVVDKNLKYRVDDSLHGFHVVLGTQAVQ